MVNRCKICGTPVSNVTICNYCSLARESRRFNKMVKREELQEMRNIGKMDRVDLPKGFKPSKTHEANI